jgi:WD40 repeat protein
VPLVTNNHSITVIDEHCGQVFFAKWNPILGRRFCATAGAGDYFVDVWDFDTIRN